MKISKFNSEQELKKEIYKHFKEFKVFKQTAFYVDKGACMYYDLSPAKKPHLLALKEKYYPFLRRNCCKNKDKKVAVISLGCGNAGKEKDIFGRFYKDGFNFKLFGVDSSEGMIELAEKNLSESKFDYKLLCADFSKEDFIKKLKHELADFDVKVYAFLGCTFGNVEQDYMADILYDMLEKGDKLWMEVAVRSEINEKGDMLLFERYLKYLDQDVRRDFYFRPLKEIGIPYENGEMFLSMIKEENLNDLKFIFRFKILKKTVVCFDGRTVTLLPGTIVDLITIRVYDADGLVNFFEERNFKFIAKECNGVGQFLFEK
ncbi:MAG: methyltransferase domain-containing protein [Candidatus Magasanikbacteria bacterium]|nr:methyltransferase domain-containing protein [Candidatus Magasanikbacteria bacterium]